MGDRGQFLGTGLAARILGVTPQAVRAATARGKLRAAIVMADGRRIYRMADVTRWSRQREKRPAPSARRVDAFVAAHRLGKR